eukprot:TRINITY_DN7567_c0_g1_i1.p2 TRINITY_DN7567_c0_g1~~TRINITY_DN7567_c0_g1_i1.p2  ORF type:complete len:109 (-),score=35.91 TRINITY_DN7567_c0_g1_i1:81-407(-)
MENADSTVNADKEPLANNDAEITATVTDNGDASEPEEDSPEKENVTGCHCITEGSLVCHQVGWCLVPCDSPCGDTAKGGIIASQCKSVSACQATTFQTRPAVNHYLLG